MNWNTGAVFVQNFARTLRVRFDDATVPARATWTDATPPNSVTNVDPILFTDSAHGRTFAGGLNGQCSVMSYTDDDGASWTPMGNACASPAFDHETIGSGPWPPGDPYAAAARHPRAVYYCAQLVYAECATSLDGGLTFLPAVPTTTRSPVHVGFCGGLHGSVHVGDNGAAWLPIRRCFDSATTTASGVVVSTTAGRTWTTRFLPGGNPEDGFDPDVATTPSGWAYVGYVDRENRARVVLTKDNGATFAGPWDVGAAAGVRTTSFTEMVAGDDGRAALAFLGTTTPGNAYAEGFPGEWHVFVATTLDAGATWTTVKVTHDPVQRGWICTDGVRCPDGGTRGRNLLDFFDAQVDVRGRVLAAFADGCIAECAAPGGTPAQSNANFATLVRQACGPSLFASVGNVEGARECGMVAPTGPRPLAGALYMRGSTPLYQADLAVEVFRGTGGTLSPDAPVGTTPRAATNAGPYNGNNARMVYDASWVLDAPDEGYALDGPVAVRLFVTTAAAAGPALAPPGVRVHLSDVGAGQNAPLSAAFAQASAPVPASATEPTEVVVTFPRITRTLANGLLVTVWGTGAGEVTAHYDAARTPSRVVIG